MMTPYLLACVTDKGAKPCLCGRVVNRGKEGGRKEHHGNLLLGYVPSLLLIQVSRAVGDLFVLVAAHGVDGLLLDEIECCGGGMSISFFAMRGSGGKGGKAGS